MPGLLQRFPAPGGVCQSGGQGRGADRSGGAVPGCPDQELGALLPGGGSGGGQTAVGGAQGDPGLSGSIHSGQIPLHLQQILEGGLLGVFRSAQGVMELA